LVEQAIVSPEAATRIAVPLILPVVFAILFQIFKVYFRFILWRIIASILFSNSLFNQVLRYPVFYRGNVAYISLMPVEHVRAGEYYPCHLFTSAL
jgi:hypothetical protein